MTLSEGMAQVAGVAERRNLSHNPIVVARPADKALIARLSKTEKSG